MTPRTGRPGAAGLPIALAAAYLVCSAPGLCAQAVPPLELSARRTTTSIVLGAAPAEGPDAKSLRAEVAEALSHGHRSQIVLQVRVYERIPGLAGLLGDRLELETTLTRELRHEPLADRYVMEEVIDRGPSVVISADTPEALLDRFFTVVDLVLPLALADEGAHYLRARYQLSPILVSPELALVALFANLGARASAWSAAEDLPP